MDTANVFSGLHSAIADPARRSGATAPVENKRAGEDLPPSGLIQHQAVVSAGNSEQAGFPMQTGQFRQNTASEQKELDQHGKQRVAEAVKNMNDFLQVVKRTLHFSVDEKSGSMIVQIRDGETNKVIRQIPTEEALKIAEQLDKVKGLLFEEQA